MKDFFDNIIQKLSVAGITNPRLEARLIISEVVNCQPSEIHSAVKLTVKQQKDITHLISQRILHKPLDKILGHREFYKYDFLVNEDVLSPRADTEILVESVLQYADIKQKLKILDLGTGSGCIIETLLKELPNAEGYAVDISAKALQTAKQNAQRLNIIDRLHFVQADWFSDDFVSFFSSSFDMIVSNPPYIPSNDICKLDTEVKDYDPLLALDGGNDGYKSYCRIAELTPQLLNTNGYIFLEAGYGQAEHIADIFTVHNLKLLNIIADLSGTARCIILKKI